MVASPNSSTQESTAWSGQEPGVSKTPEIHTKRQVPASHLPHNSPTTHAHGPSFHPNPNDGMATYFLSAILKPFHSCNCVLRQQSIPSCLLSCLLRLRPFPIDHLQWGNNHLVFILVTSFSLLHFFFLSL